METEARESVQDKTSVHVSEKAGQECQAAMSPLLIQGAIPDSAMSRIMQCNRLLLLARLSGPAAHEIINPVAAALNLAVLMMHIIEKEALQQRRLPEFQDYLSQVVKECKRAGQIASDMLMFARSSDVPTVLADMNAIVRQALSLSSHFFKLEDVALDAEYSSDLPRVKCDGNRVQQALLNLLLNAAEAVDGCEVRKVSVRTNRLEGGAGGSVKIADSGRGLPPETQEKVFDPFFTTKGKPENLGLGLTIARQIIEDQQGKIEFHTTMGKGTIVTVALFGADEGED